VSNVKIFADRLTACQKLYAPYLSTWGPLLNDDGDDDEQQ
jgi:hypothetical protein